MKKFLALTLALVMSLSLVACGDKKTDDTKTDAPDQTEQPAENEGAYKVAMITDYGDITDQSFNQTTYEACKAFAEDNSIEFSYFRPAGDNTADRVAMIEKAVDEGFNVIVMPGYAFGGAIVEAAPEFPDVKFIALDVAAGDLLETAVAKAGETYDYTPENWDLNKYVDMSNVYCAVYQEELCGYMAGYAAVKLGYKNLGFLGGMSVPAVVRYGYGFVQGASAAAAEMGVKVEMNYSWLYGASFSASTELQTMASGWYENGTEVIFACGGNMFQSVAAAAAANDGAVVGVDVDQSSQSDTVITSAMKGLSASVQWACGKVYDGSFDEIGGTFVTLGAKDNAVGLPTATWSLTKWTVDDYNAMLAKMADGSLVVDNDYSKLDSTDSLTLNLVK